MLKSILSLSFLLFIGLFSLVGAVNAQDPSEPTPVFKKNYPLGGTAYRDVGAGQLVPFPGAVVAVKVTVNLNHFHFGTRQMKKEVTVTTADANGRVKAPDIPCYENNVPSYWIVEIILEHGIIESNGTITFLARDFHSGVCEPSWNFSNAVQPIGSTIFKGNQNMGKSCTVPKVAEPVNMTNGNMWLEQNDYSLSGIGENISVNRFYNSQLQETGLFGRGWKSEFDEAVVMSYSGDIITYKSEIGRDFFWVANGTYQSGSRGFYGQITRHFNNNTFTVTFPDGRSRHFGSNGKLLWKKDRNGNQTTLSYDGNGNLTTITDPVGRTLSVTVSGGKITQLADALGVVATYTYNPDATLQTVNYPDGSKYQFAYTTISGQPYLITVKDALNNILEAHQYDAQGRAITSEVDGSTEHYSFDYSHMNDAVPYTTVTDGLSRQTKYTFDVSNGPNVVTKVEGNCNCGGGSQTTDYVYDNYLNLTKKTDALGREINYTYDTKGNPLTRTDAVGTETFTYNSFGQVLTRTDKLGAVWTNVYDGQGKLLTTTDPLNATTTVTYTNAGQVATITNPLNRVTTFNYDNSGRLGQIVDANSKTTTYGYDTRSRVTSVTNALGQATTLEYDTADRVKKVIHPDTKFITYTYDLAGRRTASTDERGFTMSYGYDGAYRLTAVTDALNHSSSMSYDAMSRLVSNTDALGNVTSYQYDAFDRITKVIYPVAGVGITPLEENFEYDVVGNLKKRYDTANRQTQYDYDVIDRLIKTTDPNLQFTIYEYNARNQMTNVIDAIGQQYLFTYSSRGEMLSQSRAGSTTNFQYDAVGNLTQKVDYRGYVNNYVYDNLNRLTAINRPAHPNEAVSYGYDDLSRVTSGTNQYGTVSMNYDNRSRLVSTTDIHGKVISYSYDETGNRTQMKLDNAVKANYVYDQIGRVTQISDSANLATTFGYDNINRLTAKVRPNGVSTTYQYDGMSRLKQIKDFTTAAVMFDRQYAYNQASQISQIVEPTKMKNYAYDNLDRLTGVSGSATESYAYDAVGNRTSSFLSTGYNYQPFNRLTQTQQASYAYDANGNQTSRTEAGATTQYSFDYDNKLRFITKPTGETFEYRYDAFGRGSKNVIGSGGQNPTSQTAEITWDGDNYLQTRSGGYTVDFLSGLGIDDHLSQSVNGFKIYPLSDHLGSVNGLTEGNGYLFDQTDYDSYGNPTNANFSSVIRFTGLIQDAFTGFYNARARVYDPKIGRFTSEDPIGFAGGDINLYGYVRNNPISFKDPSGKIPVLIPVVIGIGVLIATSPSYVNAPAPGDPVYLDDKGSTLFFNAAAGSACSMAFRATSPYVGSLINRLRIGDDIIELGISGGPKGQILNSAASYPCLGACNIAKALGLSETPANGYLDDFANITDGVFNVNGGSHFAVKYQGQIIDDTLLWQLKQANKLTPALEKQYMNQTVFDLDTYRFLFSKTPAGQSLPTVTINPSELIDW